MFRKKAEKPKNPQFEDALTGESVLVPAIIPCGHIFESDSKDSLAGWVTQKENAHEPLTCPACREEFKKEQILPLELAWKHVRVSFQTNKADVKKLTDNLQSSEQTCVELKKNLQKKEDTVAKQKHQIDHQAAQIQKLCLEHCNTQNNNEKNLQHEKKRFEELSASYLDLSKKLTSQQDEINTLRSERKNALNENLELKDRVKKIESALQAIDFKHDEQNESSTARLLSTATHLKNVFTAERKIEQLVLQRVAISEIDKKVKENIKETFQNIDRIIRGKNEIKAHQAQKTKLAEEARKLVIDITTRDAKEIMDQITLTQDTYKQNVKKEDEEIEKLRHEIKQIQEKTTFEFKQFRAVNRARNLMTKKLKSELEKQRQALDIFSFQSKLYNNNFFRRHLPTFEKWVKRSKSNCALMQAVKAKDLKKAELALQNLADPNLATKTTKYAPLVTAVKNLDVQMISLLLSYNADADIMFTIPDEHKKARRYNCFTYLCEHSAPNAVDVLLQLIDHMNNDTLNLGYRKYDRIDNGYWQRDDLFERPTRYCALWFAIQMKNEPMLIKLIEKKVNIDSVGTILCNSEFYSTPIAEKLEKINHPDWKAYAEAVKKWQCIIVTQSWFP